LRGEADDESLLVWHRQWRNHDSNRLVASV
jgi:hypothetical protein